MEYYYMNNKILTVSLLSIALISCGGTAEDSQATSSTAVSSTLSSTLTVSSQPQSPPNEGSVASEQSSSQLISEQSSEILASSSTAQTTAVVLFEENFDGANANNFYSTYRVNSNNQSLYRKAGGNPSFVNGGIELNGARFTIGEAGGDLDLSQPWTLSFDVLAASGSGKIQIYVDNNSTSGDRVFNQNATTLDVGTRFVLQSNEGTAESYIQIRAESAATLRFDNLRIERTSDGQSSSTSSGAVSSSSQGAISSSSSSSSSSVISSSSSSSSYSSSSSSAPSSPSTPTDGGLSAACYLLATDPLVNWRETNLQTDQEIVKCLHDSLGRPVGYGEQATGGYDPNGNSRLTVIVKHHPDGKSVEQQIAEAINDNNPNWIVFDKVDFREPHEIGLYRLHCSNSQISSVLGMTEAQCLDYQSWCSANNVGSANCLDQFFNNKLNNKNLTVMRNPVIGSNKTIDGRMSEAWFLFYGFMIGRDSSGVSTQKSNNVILTHLNFKGAGHTEDHYVDPDMIRVTGESEHVWIHKNSFDTTGDSAFDVKVGARNITMSFNKVVDVKRATLHGSSDSRVINQLITTTMHNNLFLTRTENYRTLGNTLRRVPLLRRGTTHMFNNVFVNYRKEILSLRVGATALWEDNLVVIDAVNKEKNLMDAWLNEVVGNLFKDISGGNFRNSGDYLWTSNAQCELDAATARPLTSGTDSVPNLANNYSSASQTTINANRLPAQQTLADYVSATAGKYGQRPFNSPLAGNAAYVVGLGRVPCFND